MRQENEPSVEDILASIKKVIASDQRVRAPARSAASASRAAHGHAADLPIAEPATEDEAEEVLDLGEAGEFIEDDDFGHSEDRRDEYASTAAAPESPNALVNDAAVEAMRESLAALTMMSEPRAKPQIVRQGETSIEALVREMLRPMLSQWLDDNLPGMVERLVAEEIRRIVGKKS